jgi:hypothetical protein
MKFGARVKPDAAPVPMPHEGRSRVKVGACVKAHARMEAAPA